MDSKITFYKEWLPLEKKHFRLLAMLADLGEFKGNLSDICRYLSLSVQTKTKTRIRESIQFLTEKNYITSDLSGRTYNLALVPKEGAISIKRKYYNLIKSHRYTAASVSSEVVLKVYLWLLNHNLELPLTNAEIGNDLNICDSTVTAATKVLATDFGAIMKDYLGLKLPDGEIIRTGQLITPSVWWSNE